MHLREPYKRKHVCIFVMTTGDWHSHTDNLIERECKDCGKKQHALVPREDWPESLWHLADVEWKDGPLADFERTC